MSTLAAGEKLDQYPDEVGLIPLSEAPDNPIPHRRTGENKTKIWALATLPLVLHFVSVHCILVILAILINGHDFNLRSRHALSKFTPLQSDITTALSSGIAVYRSFATMWSAAMLWRCVFILMGKGGISLQQIDSLLTWQMHLRPSKKSPQNLGFLISIILLAAFPSQFSGPILTGSITWSSSYRFTEGQRATGLDGGPPAAISSAFYSNFNSNLSVLYRWGDSWASNLATTAWQGSLDDERTMKRVVRQLGNLPINSTLNNITLPYFAVTKLEWLDPAKGLPPAALSFFNDSDRNPFKEHVRPGTFAMIPDNWEMETVPSSYTGVMSDTRLIVGIFSNEIFGVFHPFTNCPPRGQSLCMIYARITYVAGAAQCRNCRVSSWSTVQNDSALTVSPSIETLAAMSMMPIVGAMMVRHNSSLPTQTLSKIDGYISELLIRSYCASWTLVRSFVFDYRIYESTDVQMAIPTSRADVSWVRVGVWLSLNLLFTISGILFLFLQRMSGQELVGQPRLAALLLDTTDVLHIRHRAFCDFSTLTKDDEGLGYLRLTRNLADGHKQVEIVE